MGEGRGEEIGTGKRKPRIIDDATRTDIEKRGEEGMGLETKHVLAGDCQREKINSTL